LALGTVKDAFDSILRSLICVSAFQRDSLIPEYLSEHLNKEIDKLSLDLLRQLALTSDAQQRHSLVVAFEVDAAHAFNEVQEKIRARSLAAGVPPPPPPPLPAIAVQVTITTEPKGGLVKLMKNLTYRECAELALCGPDPESWPWIVIAQETIALSGRYRYAVSWKNGDHGEGEVEASSSPITLRPSSR
jgi:hypothetical protein